MPQPYVGEIRMFAGTFPPAGWELCAGQLMPISENDVLFQLIGTTYGGDGQETFALPDLQGRVPVHPGNGFVTGEAAGVETVTLSTAQIPSHTHPLTAAQSPASVASPSGTVLAESPQINMYIADAPSTSLAASAITPVGGSQPHENMQPFLCVNFIISLFGVYPSQS